MSFAISTAVSTNPHGNASAMGRWQRMGLLTDMAIIAATGAIAGLILRGGFNFGLKTAVARSVLAYGSLGLGSAVASADVVTAVWLKCSHYQMTFEGAKSKYITPALASGRPSQSAADDNPAHQILNGLYLGSSVAFVQAAGVPFISVDSSGKPTPLDVSNLEQFRHIISVCPTVPSVRSLLLDLPHQLNLAQFEVGCQNNGIQWHQVGEMAYDDPEDWGAFVHECTFPESELAGRRVNASELDDHAKEPIIRKKVEIILGKIDANGEPLIVGTPVRKWFEPMFQVIDKGVREGEKVLVHCQMGQSRSATLVAAYLINRFRLSTDDAISYLKLQRAQVESKFMDQLRAYEAALAQ